MEGQYPAELPQRHPAPREVLRRTPSLESERRLERETGIEPATSSLGSLRSTAELLPLLGNPPEIRWAALLSNFSLIGCRAD